MALLPIFEVKTFNVKVWIMWLIKTKRNSLKVWDLESDRERCSQPPPHASKRKWEMLFDHHCISLLLPVPPSLYMTLKRKCFGYQIFWWRHNVSSGTLQPEEETSLTKTIFLRSDLRLGHSRLKSRHQGRKGFFLVAANASATICSQG